MNEIIIKITIPESSYKDWVDFEQGGVPQVAKNLNRDLRRIFDDMGIEGAEIEATIMKRNDTH